MLKYSFVFFAKAYFRKKAYFRDIRLFYLLDNCICEESAYAEY